MDLIQNLILQHLGNMQSSFQESMIAAEKNRYNRFLISKAKDSKILDLEWQIFNLEFDLKDLVDEVIPSVEVHIHLPSRKREEEED
jgi:hypothetical protein